MSAAAVAGSRKLDGNKVVWNTFAVAAIGALFLFSAVNPDLPLDQDLGSKAAKVESLARAPFFASPMHDPQYYREAYFGVYYQIQALLRKLLPVSAVAISGYSSALCGVVYLVSASVLLRRLAGAGPWWTLFLFVNTPALVINFVYGNEASFSMAFVCSAAGVIVLRKGFPGDFAAGVLLGLAFFCRPDIFLMGPFIVVLLCTERVAEDRKGRLRIRFEWLRLLVTGASAAAVAGLYWLILIRAVPSEIGFPWIMDWRITATYLFFGFGPVVALLALFGAWRQAASAGLTQLLLPATTLIPVAFYYRDLGSTKYILGIAFGTMLCAAWAIRSMGKSARLATLAAAASLWVISITPFGVFGPARGGLWVIPAGHGPIAFGSYASFYGWIREGFFHYRYGQLVKAWDEVVQTYKADPRPVRLLGRCDYHMLYLLGETRGESYLNLPLVIDAAGKGLNQPGRQAMLMDAYTRLSYLTAPGAEVQVRQWLQDGWVKPLRDPADRRALPFAVAIGPEARDGSRELGRRILFAEAQARDGGLTPLPVATGDYDTFCFVPVSAARGPVLYSDSQFAATADCGAKEEIWGNWWPSIYYRKYAGRARTALTGK